LTTWYWLLVQRPAGALPGAAALAAFGLVVLGQAYWLSSVRRRRAADQTA
jgi:hypothetical protein